MPGLLVYRCDQTDLSVETGIRTDVMTLRDRWSDDLQISCPHCGNMHSTTVRDAYLAMTLDDYSAPAKGIFADTPPPAAKKNSASAVQVCGWLVAVNRRELGKRYGGAREFWYAAVTDPSLACERVTQLAKIGPGNRVFASRQLTGAQIGALGISPGEVRLSPRSYA